MAKRTTIMLDDATRAAARELAARWDVSMSEAIRQAVLRQRNIESGPAPDERDRKAALLEHLFTLFEGNDPAEEIARRKAEDAWF